MSISFNPENMSEGGGLLDNVVVTFKECNVVMWDYNGKMPEESPAFKIAMADDEGETYEQFWSMGSASDWTAGEDGKSIVAVGSRAELNRNSNFGLLMASLVNAGFDFANAADNDSSVFDGLRCRVIQKPVPKRGNTPTTTKGKDGKEYEKTVMVVDEILEAIKGKPAGKGKTKPKGAGAGKNSAAKKTTKPAAGGGAANTDAIESTTAALIMGILAEAEDNSVTKKDLVGLVQKAGKADPDIDAGTVNKAIGMAFNDVFLSNEEHAWSYDADAGVVSLGG